jgi:hypothetical protein
MTKRLLLLNTLLLLACVYIGRMVYQDYSEFNETHKVIAVEAETTESKGADGKAVVIQKPAPLSPPEFMVISEKNLFLESRSLQTAATTPVQEAPPPLNPKPLLVGVASVGGVPRAFVQSLRAQPGQRPTKTLKIGETYEGYKVSQIQRNRVELSYTSPSGNVTTQVLDLNDTTNRAARSAARTPVAPTQVVTAGGPAGAGAPAPGQQPMPAIDQQGRPVIRTPFGDVQAPVGMQTPNRPLSVNPANQNQLLREQEQQRMQQPDTLRQQNTTTRRNEIIDDQGRRVIRTPFGDIIRPADPTQQASPPTTIPPQPN